MSDIKVSKVTPSAEQEIKPVQSSPVQKGDNKGVTTSDSEGSSVTLQQDTVVREEGEAGGEKGTHRAKEAAGHIMTGAHLALEAAELADIAAGLAVGGPIGATIVGVGMIGLGASHIREGRKGGSLEQVVEGTGATILGVRSSLSALSLAGGAAHNPLLHFAAHAAHAVLAPLGFVHGVIDVALGGRKIYQGVKKGDGEKVASGAMGIGLGISLCAAAIGGGIPALAAAALFLGGKMIIQEREAIKRLASKSLRFLHR